MQNIHLQNSVVLGKCFDNFDCQWSSKPISSSPEFNLVFTLNTWDRNWILSSQQVRLITLSLLQYEVLFLFLFPEKGTKLLKPFSLSLFSRLRRTRGFSRNLVNEDQLRLAMLAGRTSLTQSSLVSALSSILFNPDLCHLVIVWCWWFQHWWRPVCARGQHQQEDSGKMEGWRQEGSASVGPGSGWGRKCKSLR